jgi:hypothetical protein
VLLGLFHYIVYDFTFLFEIKQISFPLWSRHFYTTKLKTLQTPNKFYTQLKEFTNHKTNTMVSTFNYITINCNQWLIQELQFTLITVKITNTCKIIDVWHNWLALYRGTINSKLTIWSVDTWADGDMRVWHYNEGFYMERKRDLIISWQYVNLAMNRGAIKQGFTVHVLSCKYEINKINTCIKL